MSTLFVYFLIINKKRAWQNSVVFNFKEKKFSGGRFKMSKILIKNPLVVATQNENRDELKNTNILIENNLIKSMDYLPEKDEKFDKIIDAKGKLVMPGMVNCHHHLYQTLTRNVPKMQDQELFPWLVNHYELWREITNEGVYISAKVGLLELLLTGCTTSTDHMYLFPKHTDGKLIDEEIKAAREIGIRFQPTRGSMTLSTKDGGLPPDDVVQEEQDILEDSKRLIEKYHDPSFGAMLRISLAPCSPFSVTGSQMASVAEFAKECNLMIHTHLAETKDEENFCLEKFGARPAKYLDKHGWIADYSWTAHSIHLSDDEIETMGKRKMGISHCPSSNMRLGSGIARIREMLDAGVCVGLGVDGSASNDSSNMLAEARLAMLLSRLRESKSNWLTARDVLWIATKGGALALGREDIGSLEEGKCADIVLYDMERIAYAGGMSDPVAALIFCQDTNSVDTCIINGKVIVENGKHNFDLKPLIERQNQLAQELIERAQKSTGIDFMSKE